METVMNPERKIILRRIILSLSAFLVLVVGFTVYANIRVEKAAEHRIFDSIDAVPQRIPSTVWDVRILTLQPEFRPRPTFSTPEKLTL